MVDIELTIKSLRLAWIKRLLLEITAIDHFTVVAKLPGLAMEARLPVTLF